MIENIKNYLSKKRNNWLFVSVVAIACFFMSSCSSDDNDEYIEPLAEYTVMLYGCGGENLDEALKLNLNEAYEIGSTDKVKMTAQIKYSKKFQNDPDLAGTRRFIVGKGQPEQEVIMDALLPLYDPDNIADFINWSKKTSPAKKYILILWNHGGGWLPNHDTPISTRAVVYDDVLDNRGISIFELTEGIKRSNTKFEVIYFDACLMNMLENLGELTDVTQYVLGAAHLTPGIGGEYGTLLSTLSEGNDIVDAMKRYCPATVNMWNYLKDRNYDLTMTDLSKLGSVFSVFKEFTDELVNSYEIEGEDYNAVKMDECYFLKDGYPFVEINSYIKALANISGNPKLMTLAAKFYLVAKDAIVCQALTEDAPRDMSWSTTLVNKTMWAEYYQPYDSYNSLVFEQQTGWSRWLKLNEMEINLEVNDEHEH